MSPTKMATIEALEIERRFAAPVSLVYAAWTQPEHLQRWHAPGPMTVQSAEADVRVGGRYRIVMRSADGKQEHIVSGVYEVVEPEVRLVYTWNWHPKAGHDPAEMRVTVTFTPDDTETLLHLRHEGFSDADSRRGHGQGWAGCLDKLLPHLVGQAG